MPRKRIRVYELARELGVENKDVLDLCDELRIGVGSHSSSIEEPQADRVRRLARDKGLGGSGQEDERARRRRKRREAREGGSSDTPAETAPGDSEDASERKVVRAGGGSSLRVRSGGEARTLRVRAGGTRDEPVAETISAPAVPASSSGDTGGDSDGASRFDATPSVPAATSLSNGESTESGSRSSRESSGAGPAPAVSTATSDAATPAAEPAAEAVPAAPPAPPAPAPAEPAEVRTSGAPEAPRGVDPASAPPVQERRPPMSTSGKPIPPPPNFSGKPIPPPPGRKPGAPPPRTPRGGAPGRPGGAGPSRGRPGGGAPGGGGGGFSRSGPPRGGPGGGPPPGGGGPGGGRGRPGGPPQRRKKRRKRRQQEDLEPQQAPQYTEQDAPVPDGEIVVPRGITIQEYAPKLNRTAADLVRMLMMAGEMVTATQSLSDDMIELIADELGAEILLVDPGQEQEQELLALFDQEEPDESELVERPPVVTVMGHVDHGKTKLLDAIRAANVVASEAGGITQHIGAYQAVRNGHAITFIDTPGHEAFTAMRARGAEATDIAVLVVAADDGVMPQTLEALSHAQAAEVPIVVAINKVDREDANPDRVRQQMVEQGLIPEEWGGDTIMVEVSALKGEGIDALMDALLLVAEVEELQAAPDRPAIGLVLEAHLDVGRGPVATALVQQGTMRVGDPVVAGGAYGKVRAMLDDQGNRVDVAGPATPVQVLGFNDVPLAGDQIRVAPDERVARTVAEARARRARQVELMGTAAAPVGAGSKLEDIFAHIQRGEITTLNLILKADVQGSLEAATDALRKRERDDVKLAFVQRGVGGITENDVNLAITSNATIIGFNVRPDRIARELAERERVEVRLYEIIYEMLEDVEAAMVGMLAPEFEEIVTGEAEVREVFSVPKVGRIAGCYVRSGVVKRGSKVRFLRDGVVIWKGEIASLKRFKEDAREVSAGYECGIGLEAFQDLKPGDIIETYEDREIART